MFRLLFLPLRLVMRIIAMRRLPLLRHDRILLRSLRHVLFHILRILLLLHFLPLRGRLLFLVIRLMI